MLMAASTACSDHCPLVLTDAAGPRRRKCFKFESFWPRFADTVTAAWARPVAASCVIACLHVKFARTAKDLRIWSQSLFGDAKLQFHMACEVILRLDEAQERRLDKFKAMSDATPPSHRKAIKSLAMLALWEIWRERNNCIFRAKTVDAKDVLLAIRRGLNLWQQGGAKNIQRPFGDQPGE